MRANAERLMSPRCGVAASILFARLGSIRMKIPTDLDSRAKRTSATNRSLPFRFPLCYTAAS